MIGKNMSGAIVHEWIEPIGGAEQVLDAMVQTYPDSDLYCLWDDDPDRFPETKVYESILSKVPLRGHKALSLPLMPPIWRHLKAHSRYEWILVSSHLFAHHARFANLPDIPKFVYAHTPARYIWNPEIDERGRSLPIRMASYPLKKLDHRRAKEITFIAANSEFVRERIQKAWDRDATVIYPPVDVESILQVKDWRTQLSCAEASLFESLPNDFLLGASRFVPYKKLDTVIRVGEQVGLPVVIAGRGPERQHLEEIARSAAIPVFFVGSPSDSMLRALFQSCLFYVFPPIEDFGIMPVEAMACGARVLVSSGGGALESVRACEGGRVVSDWSDPQIKDVLEEGLLSIDKETLPHQTLQFSTQAFQTKLKQWMELSLR